MIHLSDLFAKDEKSGFVFAIKTGDVIYRKNLDGSIVLNHDEYAYFNCTAGAIERRGDPREGIDASGWGG